MKNRTWYRLNVHDIQDVALAEIGRELIDEEVEAVIHTAEQAIPWHDTIAVAIGVHDFA